MKRLIVLCAIIYCTSLSYGQISIGLSAGSTLSTMSVDLRDLSSFKIKPIFGINFNFIAEYKINENLSLQSGLSLAQKGFKQYIDYYYIPHVDSTAEMTSRLTYLQVPLYLKINTNLNKMNFFYAIGPYFSYGIHGNIKTEITGRNDASYSDEIKWSKETDYITSDLVKEYGYTDIHRFDIGIGTMAGLKYNHYLLAVSYQFGIKNIMWEFSRDEKMSNSALSLSVGYMF